MSAALFNNAGAPFNRLSSVICFLFKSLGHEQVEPDILSPVITPTMPSSEGNVKMTRFLVQIGVRVCKFLLPDGGEFSPFGRGRLH